MAPNCGFITVHSVSFDHRGGPAFYASLPGGKEIAEDGRAPGAGDRNLLVSVLLDHVSAMRNSSGNFQFPLDRTFFPIRLACDPLGRPYLLLGTFRGPSISFSSCGGKVWAALCGDASDIGIDLATPGEFETEYPFHRVFHDHELDHALRLTGGDLAEASALLWSIKEAVVKAVGCAFHLVPPLQVQVFPSVGETRGFTFPVCLSRGAAGRFPLEIDRSIWVRSFPLETMWFSIAMMSHQPA